MQRKVFKEKEDAMISAAIFEAQNPNLDEILDMCLNSNIESAAEDFFRSVQKVFFKTGLQKGCNKRRKIGKSLSMKPI